MRATSCTGSPFGFDLRLFTPDKVAVAPNVCLSSILSRLMRTVPGGIFSARDFAPFAASVSMSKANRSSRRILNARIGPERAQDRRR
jgi:hypothetical protein